MTSPRCWLNFFFRSNFEKVIYTKLLRFREDQLENYQGPSIEYSISDYHHAPSQGVKRSSTRLSLQVPGLVRQRVSQYSILENNTTRKITVNQRKPSVAETEQSYDPFRPSRNQIGKVQADRARITVFRRFSGSHKLHQPDTPDSRRTNNKLSARNPTLTRTPQSEAHNVLSSSPPQPISLTHQFNPNINERRLSQCSSRHSGAHAVPVRTSMSYKRGVSFAHMRRRSVTAGNHFHSTPRNASTPLTIQEKYLRDGLQQAAFSPETPSVVDSPQEMPPPSRMRKNPARAGQNLAAREYWKEDASTELEKVCEEAFNRKSTASTVMTIARTEHDHSYDSPATSMGVHEDSQTSASGFHVARRKDGRELYLNRPLPLPPSFEHLESYTYRELAKTRALLKERAADKSIVLAPGYFDEVIAHLDRLMQPSTLRVNESDQRAVSTPDEAMRHTSKDEFEMLLAKGPYGFRSVSEPIKKGRERDRATVRIVDEHPISPTKPLTIRKKDGPSIISPDPDRRNASKEHSHSHEDARYYDRSQGADRRIAGLSLLDKYLEPIKEDEDKENRDPRNARIISAETRRRGWFRRHEPTQQNQGNGNGHTLPPRKEPHLQHHLDVDISRENSAKRVSDVPSDPSQASEKKKLSSAKEKFFKIFSKRENKDSKGMSKRSSDSGSLCIRS